MGKAADELSHRRKCYQILGDKNHPMHARLIEMLEAAGQLDNERGAKILEVSAPAAAVDFDPLLTSEQVDAAHYAARSFLSHHGVLLSVLSKGGEQMLHDFLIDIASGAGSEEWQELVDAMDEYHRHLKGLLSAVESAQVRLLVVSQHLVKDLGARLASMVDNESCADLN